MIPFQLAFSGQSRFFQLNILNFTVTLLSEISVQIQLNLIGTTAFPGFVLRIHGSIFTVHRTVLCSVFMLLVIVFFWCFGWLVVDLLFIR